jgi:hypothetical protein
LDAVSKNVFNINVLLFINGNIMMPAFGTIIGAASSKVCYDISCGIKNDYILLFR